GTTGKIIRLLVDDEPFDVRYGRPAAHGRVLDPRAGTPERRAESESPAGTALRISSTRLGSFAQRPAAAILYEPEPSAQPLRARARCRPPSRRALRHPRPAVTRAGTACSASSVPPSTSTGLLPPSGWTGTSSCSRRCGSASSPPSRPAPEPSSARSPPRA